MKVHSSLSLFIITIYMLIQPISAIAHEQPNVVFFLVDDLGWADTASNGSKIYQTPIIDALANEGMSFNRAYAVHPLCIGSRFALMTGKYPARIKKSKKFGTMQPKEKTMAEAFKAQGYATFFAGKWQGFILVTESGNSKVVRSYTQPVFLKNIQKFLMSLILH